MAGEVVLLSIVRDITNRLAAQRALRDSEDRYRSLVDMSPEAILVHVQGRYVFANPAAAELLGAHSPDELVGKPVLDFIHPDHHAVVVRRIEQARLGRVTPLERMRWLRLDGDPVDVEVTGTAIEYAGVPAVQIVVRSRDEQAGPKPPCVTANAAPQPSSASPTPCCAPPRRCRRRCRSTRCSTGSPSC